MKNLIYTILGFIVGGLLTYYFCPRVEQVPEKIVKPKGVITVEQAKILSDNWSKTRKSAVDSAARRQGRAEDDRSTYWDLEDIENYIGYAKKSADSLGYKMTGLRVYLGVYGENADEAKKNLTTMFIVPTGHKSNSEASTLSMRFQKGKDNLPVSPINDGQGGNQGYP